MRAPIASWRAPWWLPGGHLQTIWPALFSRSVVGAPPVFKRERWDAPEAYYKGIFDDRGRMMAIICHNTDLGDGWEREGMDPGYFKEMSEKWSYPMGINIVYWAMTH